MEKSKVIANYGIERNKKPLANIIYTIEIGQLKNGIYVSKYEQFKFKDLGYIVLISEYEGKAGSRAWNGFRTPEFIKELLGEKQWSKFCQGKRKFIVQRRVNGKNTKYVKLEVINKHKTVMVNPLEPERDNGYNHDRFDYLNSKF